MDLPSILRVVVSLVAVFGAIWWLRRRVLGGKTVARLRKQQTVTIVGRQSLGKNSSVVVLDTDGRRLLLGVTDHQVSLLRESDIPEPVVFEQELGTADLSAADEAAARSAAITYKPATPGRLSGSILSISSWKQLFVALRQGLKT